MPKLKDPIAEKTAHALIKHNFNQTKSYLETHPNSTYESAKAYSNGYLTKRNVKERAIAILESREKTSLKGILDSLEDDLSAIKPVVVNGIVTDSYRDNSTVLDTKKFIISNVYGLKAEGDKTYNTSNQTLHISLNNNEIQQFTQAIQELSNLQHKLLNKKELETGNQDRTLDSTIDSTNYIGKDTPETSDSGKQLSSAKVKGDLDNEIGGWG